MRLTTMTDYALRLLMYVGQHPDRLCTISEVAGAYGVSEAHLMKITHQLGRAGWLETVRGKGGGMRLAAAPADINLGAVVRSVEPDFALVDCLTTDNACRLTGHCRLTGIVSEALQSFLAHLDRHTLADLLPVPGPGAARLRPLTFDKRPAPLPT
jgi:Rrf2 family nitric oxide-sensitive transcriptional repressor